MKSPLVDVLRQAQNDASKEGSDCTGPAAPDDDVPPDGREKTATGLDLLETNALKLAEEQQVHDDTLPPDDIDTGQHSREPGSDEPESRGKTHEPITAGIRAESRVQGRPLLATISRLTPALCLLAFAASAAGFLWINQLAVANLNDDLDEISARPRDARNGDNGELALPQIGISVFEQVSDRDDNAAGSESSRADVNASLPTVSTRSSVDHAARQVNGTLANVIPESTTFNLADPIARDREYQDRALQSNRLGYAAYLASDYPAAEKHYQNALAIEPNHLDALAGIAATYRRMKRQTNAADAYEKLLSVDPGNTTAATAVLTIRSANAHWNIESELKHLLQRFPSADYLHFALANFYVSQDRWPEAKHEFLKARLLVPENAIYNYNAAVGLERTGELRLASRYYRAAIELADAEDDIDRRGIMAHLNELDSLHPSQL